MPQETGTRTRASKPLVLTSLVKTRASKTKPWNTPVVTRQRFGGGSQITQSKGHKWRGTYPGHNVGGPFLTVKTAFDVTTTQFSSESLDGLTYCQAHLLPATPPSSGSIWPQAEVNPQSFTSPSDLDALGATAVALCNPTNPMVEASTFLAEVHREGLPLIPGLAFWKDRTKALLGVSSEFLNAEFGWLPLVDEVTKFCSSVSHASTVINQYKRDEGKLVRRDFHFDTEKSTKTISVNTETAPKLAPTGPGFSNFGEPPRGTRRVIETSFRRNWFKGAFRYYIPTQGDSWSMFMEHGSFADKLIGTSLTPEILWELAPWSWAVDYFSNTQQVIENLQSFEVYGLMLAYGYMMDESNVSLATTWEQTSSTKPRYTTAPLMHSSVRKVRRPANPFGFGLSTSDLSPEKMAILAAAGLTLVL